MGMAEPWIGFVQKVDVLAMDGLGPGGGMWCRGVEGLDLHWSETKAGVFLGSYWAHIKVLARRQYHHDNATYHTMVESSDWKGFGKN